MECLSIEGQWWLPGKQDDAVAGKLSQTESGRLSLDLQGIFDGDSSIVQDLDNKRGLLIQGVTANAKMITLTHCFFAGGHLGFPGYAQKNYRVGTAYIGDLFNQESDLVFDQAQLSFPYLSNWLGRKVFTIASSPQMDSISCQYQRPADIEVKVRGGSLRIASTYSWNSDLLNDLRISYAPIIVIDAETTLPLLEWHRLFVRPLRDLLTFATRHVQAFPKVELICKNRLGQLGHPTPIEIVHPDPGGLAASTSPKYLHPHELLFAANDVSLHLGSLIDRWLCKYEELENVMMLFFGPIYNEHMYIEHQFLNYAYAAEAYHRIRNGKNFHFVDRVRALLSQFKAELAVFPLDAQQLARKIDDTRNYYVHNDNSLEDRAAKGESFFRMVQVLQSLLEVCFLFEMELDSTQIQELVERNENVKFTARMIKEQANMFA